jgi:hypothetical protein
MLAEQKPEWKIRDEAFAARRHERLASIFGRDRVDHFAEQRRRRALLEVEAGGFSNLDDIPIPPTPEQLEKFSYAPFTADKIEGTVRSMRTVRRVGPERIEQLHRRGILDDDTFVGAKWYRAHWERSGLDVSIQAAQYGDRIVGVQCYGAMPRTEHQAISRDYYRSANMAISIEFRATFDCVTLLDMTLNDAARSQGCRLRNLVAAYRAAALEVYGFAAPHLPIRDGFEKSA